MDYTDDTIAAIGTATGTSGISIVRVSGPDTFSILDKVFECSGKKPSDRDAGTFVYGHTRNEQGRLDEVLLLIMRAPHSYTCEDMVEIQGHGGSQCAKRNLRAVLEAGARSAEPGEFTRRAFLNGRLDLVQAEAVLDLIHSHSDRAADAALEQLEGKLSESFNGVYDDLIQVAAELESTLDFPEDELPDWVLPDILKKVIGVQGRFENLVVTWDEGHFLREGARVVIGGKPNVGKSTMLNALLGSDRAIVSDIPGTTRDVIEEGLVLDGIPLRLIDTAGLRETDDQVESEGINRARKHLEKADIFIYIMDASESFSKADRETLASLAPEKCIIVLNKCDLAEATPELEGFDTIPKIKSVLIREEGLQEVISAITAFLKKKANLGPVSHAVISERHRKILLEAGDLLKTVVQQLESKREDMVPLASAQLRDSVKLLGEATGREYHEELLDNIFSRFCIGK